MSSHLIAQFEAFIRRDPAQRGLLRSSLPFEQKHPPLGMEPPKSPALGLGELAKGAEHMAAKARQVAIVTGFYVPKGTPPAAETDGIPGSVLFASIMEALGIPCCVVTDRFCEPALRAISIKSDIPLWIWPEDSNDPVAEFFSGPGSGITHLIACERVGPCHTLESLAQLPESSDDLLAEFLAAVPRENWGCCHNMRGEVIDEWTPPVHELFQSPIIKDKRIRTIGIGDGGNEVGMGKFSWGELRRRCALPSIPCSIATDFTILAGTSNWGAQALGASVALLRGNTEILEPFDSDQQLESLAICVELGPAVDGITRGQTTTVDGLPFLTYIQPWEGIRKLLGLRA